MRTGRAGTRKTWCWRRWITASQRDLWTERLEQTGITSWAFIERPARVRILLEVYVDLRPAAVALHRQWKGGIRAVNNAEWIGSHPAPTRIGRRLEIVHGKTKGKKAASMSRLHIPHGMAFGSGDHATTCMLLRALAVRSDWSRVRVLDLGTGSGILALAARLFGATQVRGTDFDPDAVRTARQNEALNFARPSIQWRQSDVKQLRATPRYDLVLANLFSGILVEAAARISGCVSPKGHIWLSGILHSQQEEVIAAYLPRGLRLARVVRRGKWVMLQFSRP